MNDLVSEYQQDQDATAVEERPNSECYDCQYGAQAAHSLGGEIGFQLGHIPDQ